MSETKQQKGGALKQIDLNEPSFMANGKRYFIEQELSIERFCEFQDLEWEFQHGISPDGLMKKFRDIHKMCNRSAFVEIAVELESIVKGIAKVKEREPVVLKMVALFINEENEDRGKFSKDMYVRKIEDWKAEGINMGCFFSLAAGSVNGFLRHYINITQAISNGKTAISGILED